MYGEKEMNAHGCQANGAGVSGLGDGFSWAEGIWSWPGPF